MRMKHIAAVAAMILLFAAAEGQTPATMPSISFNPGAATAPADTNADKAATPEKLTATKAFAEAPAEVFPTLDRMTRLDMIDYFNSGSPKPSKNAFKGDSRILSASDSQITVQTSDVSDVELSLIESGNDTIIMVISTLKTPADDSGVKFYTTRWKEIDKGLFIVPLLDDWITPEGKERKADLENAVPFMLARFSYAPETGTMTLTNNLGGFLPEEDTAWAGGLLRSKLIYKWNGKKMVKVKE